MYYGTSLETGEKVFGRLAYKMVNQGDKTVMVDVIQVRIGEMYIEVFIDSSTIGFDDLDSDNAERQRRGEKLRWE